MILTSGGRKTVFETRDTSAILHQKAPKLTNLYHVPPKLTNLYHMSCKVDKTSILNHSIRVAKIDVYYTIDGLDFRGAEDGFQTRDTSAILHQS